MGLGTALVTSGVHLAKKLNGSIGILNHPLFPTQDGENLQRIFDEAKERGAGHGWAARKVGAFGSFPIVLSEK